MTDLPAMRPGAEERRQLLQRAERLWQELQDNELGGYSGINRPFYICEVFKEIAAAERARILALLRGPTTLEAIAILVEKARAASQYGEGWSLYDSASAIVRALADEIERSAQERKAPALGGGQDDAEA